MKRKRWLRRLALLAVVSAAALALAELAVRRFVPPPGVDYPRGMFEADEAIGYKLARNFHGTLGTPHYDLDVRTNELGMRGPPLRARGDGHRRVLLIGDSFVFGFATQEEQMIGAGLASELAPDLPGVEVLNAGAPGYSPAHEMLYLRELLPATAPDLVALFFYVGNDIVDAPRGTRAQTVFRGFLVNRQVPESHAGVLGAARFELARWRENRALVRWIANLKLRGVQQKLLASFASASTPQAKVAWMAVEKCLAEMQRACAEAQVPLLLVVIPAQAQVDPAFRAASFAGADPPRDQLLWSQTKLAEYATRVQLPLLDLTPSAESTQRSTPLYQPLDDHFNAAGNRFAAREVAERLRELGWIDRLRKN